jgi:sugar lactone lactonase YvrE
VGAIDGRDFPSERERFRTHGLYLKEGRRGVHTLYVVHHGGRESVEVFELATRPTPMTITWIGCVVAPDPIGLNAVVALPDGGFAATNFDPRQPPGGRGGFSAALTAGERTGEVWEWHPRSGWAKVPGSEAAGANGIEISPDGRWYYIAEWGNRSFMRLSRGKTPPDRQEIPLGFRVDNVRWGRDGMLLVAGQGEPGGAVTSGGAGNLSMSIIGRIDPKTMTYTAIVKQPTNERLSAATVAVQVGDEIWAGSFRGDRIARYPSPHPGRQSRASKEK